jgi:serine/threonine protein kinase/Tfp pilus assembly protein PilF
MTVKCPKCHSENPETKQFCADCGTQLVSAKDISAFYTETLQTPIRELARGTTLAGRYEIIEELGKGGMGRVYKVFDTDIKEKVALKLLKPEIASDRETIERFSNELKYARKISHRNVCRMYDLGKEAGNYFITMEYVSGEDLKSFIRRSRQLVVGTAIFIAKEVCDGLAEAHRLGVVHRDLKPGNIMIDKEGNAKVMDFGIARSVSVRGITGAGVMIGTPEYMSPEQVEGKEVDLRSDIYSLGIILYEMLTGQVPFEGDTPFTIGVKQKSESPKDPKSLNAQIPQDLSRLILKCLEKDKERRYQNAAELRANLEKIEKGIPTTERPIPKRRTVTSKPITLTVSRKKLVVPLSILVAIAVIGIGLWRFLPKHHVAPSPMGKPTLAILYFENVSGDKMLDPWKTGLADLLITKLSQSKFVNVLDGNTVYGILKKLNLDDAKKYTRDDLIKVVDAGRATYSLNGSLMKAGQNIIITLSLQRPQTGELISSSNVECRGEEEIFLKVDEVAQKIKSDLKLTPDQIASDSNKEVAKITTSSPEAYKYFIEGQKYHFDGKYAEAIQIYEKAVAADPDFAMAYRGLAQVYLNLGYDAKGSEIYEKAFKLSDRVSDRERAFIQGAFYYQKEQTCDKAVEAFKSFLKLYPDDTVAIVKLADAYSNLEEWEKAEEYYEIAERAPDSTYVETMNLTSSYEGLGFYEKAKQLLDAYSEKASDEARVHGKLGYNELYRGRFDLALSEAERVFLLDPNNLNSSFLKGDVLYLSGKLADGEKEYLQMLKNKDISVLIDARGRLMYLYLAQGRFKEARSQAELRLQLARESGEKSWIADALLASGYVDSRKGDFQKGLEGINEASKIYQEFDYLPGQRWAETWKGIISLDLGLTSQAQEIEIGLKNLMQKSQNKKALRYLYLLNGRLDVKKENYSAAIENHEKAISLLPYQSYMGDEHALFINALATAYYQGKFTENAYTEFEQTTSLTTGRARYGDLYAKSFYMLGKIAEQQGDKTKAIEYFSKFLDLWKDADPGLPEVEDAKKRLAGIS